MRRLRQVDGPDHAASQSRAIFSRSLVGSYSKQVPWANSLYCEGALESYCPVEFAGRQSGVKPPHFKKSSADQAGDEEGGGCGEPADDHGLEAAAKRFYAGEVAFDGAENKKREQRDAN